MIYVNMSKTAGSLGSEHFVQTVEKGRELCLLCEGLA